MSVHTELERLSRHELIVRAQRLGVQRAELMTRVELTDEIVRLSESDPTERRRVRGWLGIARDLVASVVEQGLHLPEAAALIRGETGLELGKRAPAPVATVTLAEIYSAQGHHERALKMLDQVLDKEPDHDAARGLRDRLASERQRQAAARAQSRARETSPFELEPEPDEEPGEREEAEAAEELEAPEELGSPERAEPEPLAPGFEGLSAEASESEIREPLAPEAPTPQPLVPEAAASEVPPRAAPSDAPARDALLLLRQAGKVLVFWELRGESVRRAEERWPNGQAVVRVVGWRARWEGAERVDHDLEIAEGAGGAIIDALGEVHVARAILGWRAAGVVHLFAIAHELQANAESAYELSWSPPGHARDAKRLASTATRALLHWGLGPGH